MRTRRQLILIIATGAAIASCRRANPETAGSQPYDLRRCAQKLLQSEGFQTRLPYPSVMVATTGPVGSLNNMWNAPNALPDGSTVDQMTVWFGSGLQVQGETRVRDRDTRETHGWRVVPNSARVKRAIEKLENLCPVPIAADTTG